MSQKKSRVFVEEDLFLSDIPDEKVPSRRSSAANAAMVLPVPEEKPTIPVASGSPMGANARPFDFSTNTDNTSSQQSSRNAGTVAVDWYGNTVLHSAYARVPVDLEAARRLIETSPHFVRQRNQFGRLPLHYALDRSKVDEDGLKLLLTIYPEGLDVVDHHGDRPYDLALRWKLSRSTIWLLLYHHPDVDKAQYLKLKYGFLGSLASFLVGNNGSGAEYAVTNGSGDNNNNARDEEDEEHSHSSHSPTAPVSDLSALLSSGNSSAGDKRRNSLSLYNNNSERDKDREALYQIAEGGGQRAGRREQESDSDSEHEEDDQVVPL